MFTVLPSLQTLKSKNSHSFLSISRLLLTFVVAFFSLFVAPQVMAADPAVTVTQPATTYYLGQEFYTDLILTTNGSQHSSSTINVSFDPSLVEFVAFEKREVYFNYFNEVIDNEAGTAQITGSYFGNSYTTGGTLVRAKFKALAVGSSAVDFSGSQLLNSTSQSYSVTYPTASFTLASPLANATLSLQTEYDNWALNDSQWVDLMVNSQGNQVAGVDVVLSYDPTVLQYQTSQWDSLFANQPSFTVDQQAGKIYISGVANQGAPFNGVGRMARLQFLVLQEAVTNVSFDWELGSTLDSNIVSYTQTNTDLLTTQPESLTITIGEGATLNFAFTLKDFVGDYATVGGSISVGSVVKNFANTLGGVVSELFLGTLNYGATYATTLHVPGYLKVQQSLPLNIGLNPESGNLAFGELTPGDVNGDNVINTFDLSSIFSSWNSQFTTKQAPDLNGDGRVNSFDVGILYTYFNESSIF